ncbi:hypothetical protein ACFLJF_001293 [Salmonella enterica]
MRYARFNVARSASGKWKGWAEWLHSLYREKRMIETLTVIKLVLEIVVAILQLIVLFV